MLKRKFFANNYAPAAGIDVVIFSTGTNLTKKYTITSSAVVTGTNLSSSASTGSAAGNLNYGLFVCANGTANTSKYTFAGDGVTAGTSMGIAIGSGNPATAGNGDLCVTAPGSSAAGSNATIKYTYSGDVVSAGSTLSASILTSSSTGNKDVAIFAMDNATAVTNRYDYASDVRSAGANLATGTQNSGNGSHSGNGTIGIIGRASALTTNSYNFTANTCVAGTSMTSSRTGRGMAGNVTVGIFGMGPGSPNSVNYTYAGNVVAVGTSLLASTAGPAVCANPTGVNV